MPDTPTADTTTAAIPRPFVLGGRCFGRPSRQSVSALGVIIAAIAIPLRGLYQTTGSSMEEGFMLVFPKRLLAGDVPNVDYLHLYGPFSIHVLAGWYRVFGYTIEAQRTFGLIQHLGIIFGVYTLARVWGRLTAAVAALTVTLLVLTPIGLSALAWEGAVALALWSVVFALRAHHTAGRPRTVSLVVAGLLEIGRAHV